jgi:hypothetical protein
MRQQWKVFVAVVSLVGVGPGRLGAQEESRDPHLRNDCRFAAQALETGHPAPHVQWAFESIPRCDYSGPATLAALWNRPTGAADERLFHASYRLRDSRLTAAVIGAAENRSHSPAVRLNALRVLVGHAVPDYLLSTSDLLRSDTETRRYFFPSVSHVSVREGTSPVGQETIRRILHSLHGLSSDPDTQVAAAAMRAHRQLCLRLGSTLCP